MSKLLTQKALKVACYWNVLLCNHVKNKDFILLTGLKCQLPAFCVEFACSPVYAWVLSGYSGFIPSSKNMHVRLIGVSKIVLRSECEHSWLSCVSLFGPVMDWRPVQGVPRLSPDDRWDRLKPPRDPTDGLSGHRKWMDGCAVTRGWRYRLHD